jgi:hypothetical protein
MARPGIAPRRLVRRGGASVVRRNAAINRTEIPMPKPTKKSAKKASSKSNPARTTGAKPPPRAIAHSDVGTKNDAISKQSRIIALLRLPAGTTIAAMMQETGWQQHSVRGFLAGVVRKKLKLKLDSDKVDGTRIYRIKGEGQSKASGPQSKRRSA